MATAACLIGATAYAQTDNRARRRNSRRRKARCPPTSAVDAGGRQRAPTGGAANASATVDASGTQVIASQPVPDTRANRAAYGQPLSHAGKRTAPKGN